MQTQFIVFSLVGCALAAPAHAKHAPHNSQNDDIASLLAEEGVDAELDVEVAVAAHRQWALGDLLRLGFVHSKSPQTRAAEAMSSGDLAAMDLIMPMLRAPTFFEKIERQAALARLQGAPAHQARHVEALAFDIPLADHPLVDTYIEYFSGRGRWFFSRWLERAERYMPVMQPILREAGLPEDIIYLAMIESGFAARATSSAKAAGYWQFMPATGKRFNLRQDFWVDERRDFIRATHAAAKYLQTLHAEFDDWHLAWAAYNAGEGRIRRALKKYQVSDFWSLIGHKDSLAKETQHYVPKIIAAAIVAKNRVAYGFVNLEALPPLHYEEVEVTDSIDLRMVAQQASCDYSEIAALNPALVQGVTPPRRNVTIRVPAGQQGAIATWVQTAPKAERLSYERHQVQKGDTLFGIARRYGTTISAIGDFNNIGNARALRLGTTLVIPQGRVNHRPPPMPSHALGAKPAAATQPAAAKPAAASDAVRHRVRPGETLWSISQRYQVSVAAIKEWNKRDDNTIKSGEVLAIFAGKS